MALTVKKLRPRKIAKYLLRKLGLLPMSLPKAADFQQGSAYGVDRLLVIAGFGAVASGWLLMPGRHVRAMSLTVGPATLEGDRRCLLRSPRPDLVKSFPDLADAAPLAGFQAVFHGLSRHETPRGPFSLRLHLEDGSVPHLRIPESVVRFCDGSASLATLTHYFPSLANEPFLDAFASAYAVTVRQRAATVVPLSVSPCARAAVAVLPREADDVLLALADIDRRIGALPPEIGLVLLACAQHPHARLLDRVTALRERSGRAVSVFELADPTYALWSLDTVLAALDAERFWFCGPEVVPTRTGWHAAAEALAAGRDDLALFLRRASAPDGEPEGLSFVWSSEPFRAWAATAPFFLGGFHRDNHLPSSPRPVRHHGAIGLLRGMVAAEPTRRVDERLYRAATERNTNEARP